MSGKVKRAGALLWVLLLLCAGALTLAACFDGTNKYRKNVSEIRENIYVGESEHFEVVIYVGERENPYAMDGTVGEMNRFFLVIASPKFNLPLGEKVKAEVSAGGKKYVKELISHPFNGSHAADLGGANAGSDNVMVNLRAMEFDEDVTAVSLLTENMLTSDEAYRKGAELLKDSIENTLEDGKYHCEIQVKLIDKTKVDGKLFWHVSVYGKSGEMYAVLLEADKTAAPNDES